MLLFTLGFRVLVLVGTTSDPAAFFGFLIIMALGYGAIGFSVETAFILCIVCLATAVGLFLEKRWAWILTIILSIFSITFNLATDVVFYPAGLLGSLSLLISIVVPVYLARTKVRRIFWKPLNN